MTTIAGKLVTPTEVLDGTLVVEDDRIISLEPGRWGGADFTFGDALVVPGFLDVHMHGLDRYMAFETDDLRAIARLQVRFGTTGYLPTAASLSVERFREFGRHVATARANQGPDEAAILGAHFEGPFINPAGRAGMDEQYLRPIDLDECRGYLDATGDALRLMTLSPELDGAEALVRLLREHNVVAAVGHSRATPDELNKAVHAGLSHVCHCFNAFEKCDNGSNEWPWKSGLLDAVLHDERLYGEIICDLVHVRPEHVQLAAERFGPDRFIAITDSLAGAGYQPGEYQMADGRIFSTRDGAARLVDDGTLVGSVLTMDRAFANLVQTCQIDLIRAVKFTSTNAARSLGLNNTLGSIAPGARADLAVLDNDFHCQATFRKGRIVYSRDN
ncbi:MAG: amidohydrolase family protein [Pirellulales bacterium]|nr:amidohydrolase family protein [Pirellulales bacterium]